MIDVMNLAKSMAITAGKHIVSLHGKGIVNQKGATFNLVTQADTESETLIIGEIKKNMTDSVILSEESHWEQSAAAEKLWIIDPLDGTNNFAHSIPQYCVSIAYAERGIVKIGVVYDPVREELFSAEIEKGAFLNGEKIGVSSSKTLQESMISTGFYYDRGELMENTLRAIHRLFKSNIRGIRRMGSAALDLCWVASGRFDGYFEYMLSPWDFAAGTLIIKEAGGVVGDRDGLDRGLKSQGIMCSNGHIHNDFLKHVLWNDMKEYRF